MKQTWLLCLIMTFFWAGKNSFAQESNLRSGKVKVLGDTLVMDTLLIYPGSISLKCGENDIPASDFLYDSQSGAILLKNKCADSISYNYRTFPFPNRLIAKTRDTSQIYSRIKGDREKFLFTNTLHQSRRFWRV